MAMFCFQCQETARGKGCDIRGVCGKTETVANLQDLLIYTLKGIAYIVTKGKIDVKSIPETNEALLESLFMTITNANFDQTAIERQIKTMIRQRDRLFEKAKIKGGHDAATFKLGDQKALHDKANAVGVLQTKNEDIRSLREMITYGLKGMAAYLEHAHKLGKKDLDMYAFMYATLAALLNDRLTKDDLIDLTLKTGQVGLKAMALLDDANTSTYGHPVISQVNIGVGDKPGILISGHDLSDIKQLLEQTQGTGVDVYTHSEMLPAHYYPDLKPYKNFVGNYGNAWWKQLDEFASFNGPILFTSNCIVPPKNDEIAKRIFTTGAAGYPGCWHIEPDADGKKDFSVVIEAAKKTEPPIEIESGHLLGGFAHNQVLLLADKILAAIEKGSIRKFVVMAGCDGRFPSRAYYTKFASKLPTDTIILTAGCAKYRYNKLDLGQIDGIPRVLDAGQCNDSYSLILIASKLKEVLGLDDINELPIVYNIAWYEQKAVIVLLALLAQGIKNIHLGPTLPGFLSPNVAEVLTDAFHLSGISTADEDVKAFLDV